MVWGKVERGACETRDGDLGGGRRVTLDLVVNELVILVVAIWVLEEMPLIRGHDSSTDPAWLKLQATIK